MYLQNPSIPSISSQVVEHLSGKPMDGQESLDGQTVHQWTHQPSAAGQSAIIYPHENKYGNAPMDGMDGPFSVEAPKDFAAKGDEPNFERL
jgi:hypothetical protein